MCPADWDSGAVLGPNNEVRKQFLTAARALLAAASANEKRCQYCDGTGSVHRIDGEFIGECTACSLAASTASDKQGWISVRDQLPPVGKNVLCFVPESHDATICAEAVLDLRAKLLHLIKYEGMANDHFTNEMYGITTDALFAASRIKGASK